MHACIDLLISCIAYLFNDLLVQWHIIGACFITHKHACIHCQRQTDMDTIAKHTQGQNSTLCIVIVCIVCVDYV
jgi:hypothetical protein